MNHDGKRTMAGRGSLTIEAALLMPILLLGWFGVVSACLFVHNRAWLTAAAYESAITGSWDAICSQGDVEGRAREKLQILLENPLYGSKDLSTAVEENGGTLSVSVEGSHGAYGGLVWHFHVKGSRKLCRPVPSIRKVKSLKEIGEQIGGARDGG